jgi:plasmid maintenance system antidote protein VapI
MEEVFKPVVGYEGYYEVSNFGNVYSVNREIYTKRGRIERRSRRQMKFVYGKFGYVCVNLSKNNKGHRVLVHRIVAKAFIPNPDNKPQVNHKDLNKANNCVDNLEWNTALENNKHAQLNKANSFGESHYRAKLTEEIIKEIRYIYRSQLYSFADLAAIYGVSAYTIRSLIIGKIWRNVDYPTQSYREVNREKLSAELKKKLIELNITQKQLAETIGSCRADICRAVSGNMAGLNISIKLAAWLKINYKELLVD